jgi:hypothetical protein
VKNARKMGAVDQFKAIAPKVEPLNAERADRVRPKFMRRKFFQSLAAHQIRARESPLN